MAELAPHVIPALRYRDAPKAIDFLTTAFGFEKKAVFEGEGGRIDHAQLTYGDGMVMLGSAAGGVFDETAASIYVIVEDPDAHHAQSSAAGAEIVIPLTDQEYGSRDYTAKDLEGNYWSFGTYRPTM